MSIKSAFTRKEYKIQFQYNTFFIYDLLFYFLNDEYFEILPVIN